MINGRDDKAGISQRLCSVIMPAEPPAPTVGENNQRQLGPCGGTILYARQPNIGGRRKITERYIFQLPCAWIPDGAC